MIHNPLGILSVSVLVGIGVDRNKIYSKTTKETNGNLEPKQNKNRAEENGRENIPKKITMTTREEGLWCFTAGRGGEMTWASE
jgi:hypothetical protein